MSHEESAQLFCILVDVGTQLRKDSEPHIFGLDHEVTVFAPGFERAFHETVGRGTDPDIFIESRVK